MYRIFFRGEFFGGSFFLIATLEKNSRLCPNASRIGISTTTFYSLRQIKDMHV